MSDRTDTGQSDSIMAPVIPHIIINVESFTHWFANMQPPCIPEIPQTLRYRLLSQWAVLEIQNILFCFISMQPPVWNFEVQGCCFMDICVCECVSAVREAPSLPPAAPCFSHPCAPYFQNGRQNSLSGKRSHLFSKSDKTETTLTHWLSKRPWNVISGEDTDNLQTTFLSLSWQTIGRNEARFTAYHFKILQRRGKLIFVIIFIWRNEATSSCSCNTDLPSASKSSSFRQSKGGGATKDTAAVMRANASVQSREQTQIWAHRSLLRGKGERRDSPVSH